LNSTSQEKGLGVVAARGVFWFAGGQVLRHAIQSVAVIVLATLLTPQDYGLLAMALAFSRVAQLLTDFGIGVAIIQARELDETVLSSCFWANALVAAALTAGLALVSPFVAGFYGDPRVGPVLAVLSISLFLSGSIIVPRAALYKAMHFAEIVKAQVAGSFAGSVVAITLAYSGFGVWSLVLQPIAGSIITFTLTLLFAPWWPRFIFSWPAIRPLIRFGANVLGTDLIYYGVTNADALLIGKILGSSALGVYSLALQIMLYPLEQVSGTIVKVLFPALSQLTDDMHRFRHAFLRAVATIALITFPLMMGMFALADDLVLVVFGQKWVAMIPILKIFCWLGMLHSVSGPISTIFFSTGRARTQFVIMVFAAPVLLAAFLIGIMWGVVGVALAYAITSLVLTNIGLSIALRIAGLTFRDFLSALSRPFIASLMMYVAVSVASRFIADYALFPAVARLIACILIGGMVYALTSFVVNRMMLAELIRLCRAALLTEHVKEARAV
jgi:PST family polysaccharide transporter